MAEKGLIYSTRRQTLDHGRNRDGGDIWDGSAGDAGDEGGQNGSEKGGGLHLGGL
jgi:hypothetical protein